MSQTPKANLNFYSINTDPEATIIAKSNYAIIGDLHEVLPALSEEIKKVKK